jgi:hypothetical protein
MERRRNLSIVSRHARRACLRFDDSGHGPSEGRFDAGTIGTRPEERIAIRDLNINREHYALIRRRLAVKFLGEPFRSPIVDPHRRNEVCGRPLLLLDTIFVFSTAFLCQIISRSERAILNRAPPEKELTV